VAVKPFFLKRALIVLLASCSEPLRISRGPDHPRISYLCVARKLVPCLLHIEGRKLPYAMRLQTREQAQV